MSKRITELTAAVAGDLAATTTAFEVATNVTTVPLSRKITLGVLRDFLASAATGFAAVAVTVLQLGVGTASVANRGILTGGNVVASAGSAQGIRVAPTLVAAVNADNLQGGNITTAFTPGAFTGLLARGLVVNSFSVATFTSPGDPIVLAVGGLTGTGATNAIALSISVPVGATNNYIIADANLNTFTVLATGQVGIGTAAITKNAIRITASLTAASASAAGIANNVTLVAAANGDSLSVYSAVPTLTPGAFTGVGVFGFNIAGFSVATFTTPADPASINIQAVTGTGATNAFGIRIAPPTGATNNYLIAHTTPATFNVTAVGAGTFGGGITSAGLVTISTGNRVQFNNATNDAAASWYNNGGAGVSVLTATGPVLLQALGAFVAADKYLVVDAAGNLHKSALGPAS